MAAEFIVKHKQPEFIIPVESTPRELKQLSDIDDSRSIRFHYQIIMFYDQKGFLMEAKEPVIVIKEAVAKTLEHYYPIAGRLIEGLNDKYIVDCNSEGVMFVEADSNHSLQQLGEAIFPPSPFPHELLKCDFASQEMVGCPLMLIQVTRFICGGFALGVRVNHVICDAFGLVQFLNAVAEMAKGASSPSIKPVWQRELLSARNPPRITFMHPEYDTGGHSTSTTMELHDNLSNQSFFFGPEEISTLRKHLDPHLRNSSKFDLITACIWRSRTIALKIPPDEDVIITCSVNVRGKNLLHLPNGYYGNAIANPASVTKAKNLYDNSLGYAVELLMKAKAKVNVEYVRSVIDLMATKGRPPFSSSWNLVVSDLSRLGFDEIDFGWGKPIYGGTLGGGISRAANSSGYARCRKTKGVDGILVPMCLPKVAMERFEEELKKLTHQNMNDFNNSKINKITSKL